MIRLHIVMYFAFFFDFLLIALNVLCVNTNQSTAQLAFFWQTKNKMSVVVVLMGGCQFLLKYKTCQNI